MAYAEVILTENIPNLGAEADLVRVRRGFARNFLTAKDIHDRLAAELNNIELPKHAVALDKPFKESGDHEMEVRLHRDVTTKLRIRISTPKRAPAEEEPESAKKFSRRRSAPKNSS